MSLDAVARMQNSLILAWVLSGYPAVAQEDSDVHVQFTDRRP
jgi:hypothetical protein